jgi:hypothetical protein
MSEDALAGLKWLAEVKKYAPERTGLVGAGLGASVAPRVASTLHVKLGALVLLTPKAIYPGLELEADVHGVPLDLEVMIIASVEDQGSDDRDKTGVRHILYTFERDRDPAPHAHGTPAGPHRGKQPQNRTFGEREAYGTAMLTKVRQMDAWIAAWLARLWNTYPNAILFDGSVDIDKHLDLDDPSWLAGTEVKGPGGAVGRVMRWGSRVMVGAELPNEVRTIVLRIRVTRGEIETGQTAEIEFPSGVVHAVAREHLGARQMPIQIYAIPLEAEKDTGGPEARPSFEAEYELPPLPGSGPYAVSFGWGYDTGGGVVFGAGFDPDRPETWTPIPDSLVPGDTPKAPPGTPPPDKPK